MADVICHNPNCTGKGAPQIAGSQYCEFCGDELGGSKGAQASDALCPKCLNTYTPGDAICSICGASLPASSGTVTPPVVTPQVVETPQVVTPPVVTPPVVTPPVVTPPEPTATATNGLQPGSVKLCITQGKDLNRQYLLDMETMMVGRLDADSNNFPDIDLEDQDTEYVHRKHATLTFEGGKLMVCHHGSVNPTLINNQPVPLNEKRPLGVGDRLKVGKVVMQLKAC